MVICEFLFTFPAQEMPTLLMFPIRWLSDPFKSKVCPFPLLKCVSISPLDTLKFHKPWDLELTLYCRFHNWYWELFSYHTHEYKEDAKVTWSNNRRVLWDYAVLSFLLWCCFQKRFWFEKYVCDSKHILVFILLIADYTEWQKSSVKLCYLARSSTMM